MKKKFFPFVLIIMLCVGGTLVDAQGVDPLDVAIREASNYLNGNISKGNKVVFLNITSNYPDLSEYIISLLSENAVNDKIFSVVDRIQIESLRAELSFQMSGDVDDNSAQSIGKMLGAQSIVSGSVSKIGSLYRLQVKAIEVQTAEVKGQWSKNFPSGSLTIAALTENYTPADTHSGISSSPGITAGQTQAPVKPISVITQIETSTWDVRGRERNIEWFATLVIEKVDNNAFGNTFEGYFEWYYSGALLGREIVSGMYTSSSRKINLQGTKIEDGRRIGGVRLGLGTYEAVLSEDGNNITKGTFGEGTSWEAIKRVSK